MLKETFVVLLQGIYRNWYGGTEEWHYEPQAA